MFEREPNIDVIFRNGLKNLEVLPPADVWDNIPPMPVKRSRLKIVYGIAAGVAALVSLAFLARWYVNNNNTPVLLSEVTAESNNHDVSFDIAKAEPVIRPVEARIVNLPAATTPAESVIAADSQVTEDASSELIASADQPERDVLPDKPLQLFSDEITIIKAGRFEGVDENLKTTMPDLKGTKTNQRFLLGASLSPAMGFSRSGEDVRMAELINNEKTQPAYTTGLSVAYMISDRLSIQSGIGLSSMGQTISDVAVYAGLSDYYSVKSSYLYSVETSAGLILAGNTDLYLADNNARVGTLIPGNMADPSKYMLTRVGSDIRQVFRYLELPVMIRYKLIDRKVGLNVSGGVAYGFLVDNQAYTGKGSDMIHIGHTEGVSNFNLSSQLGLGMEYNISRQVIFNLEPVFRYYVTPLSEFSGSLYKPYSVGFSSGFFFKF